MTKKLCIDCKYCKFDPPFPEAEPREEHYWCTEPSNQMFSPVTGKFLGFSLNCINRRVYLSGELYSSPLWCGPLGKLFEPKEKPKDEY